MEDAAITATAAAEELAVAEGMEQDAYNARGSTCLLSMLHFRCLRSSCLCPGHQTLHGGPGRDARPLDN